MVLLKAIIEALANLKVFGLNAGKPTVFKQKDNAKEFLSELCKTYRRRSYQRRQSTAGKLLGKT